MYAIIKDDRYSQTVLAVADTRVEAETFLEDSGYEKCYELSGKEKWTKEVSVKSWYGFESKAIKTRYIVEVPLVKNERSNPKNEW